MSQQPPEVIWALTSAVVSSASLHAVADVVELDVADQIADESVSPKQLAAAAEATSTHSTG